MCVCVRKSAVSHCGCAVGLFRAPFPRLPPGMSVKASRIICSVKFLYRLMIWTLGGGGVDAFKNLTQFEHKIMRSIS